MNPKYYKPYTLTKVRGARKWGSPGPMRARLLNACWSSHMCVSWMFLPAWTTVSIQSSTKEHEASVGEKNRAPALHPVEDMDFET